MSDKILASGFLFSPLFWPKDRDPWKSEEGRCHASVWLHGSSQSSQCTRKSVVEREVRRSIAGSIETHAYCKQHDPVAVKCRRDKRDAKYKAQREAQNAAQKEAERIRKLKDAALDAIQQIAVGHNDPRGLALAVLAKYEASK